MVVVQAVRCVRLLQVGDTLVDGKDFQDLCSVMERVDGNSCHILLQHHDYPKAVKKGLIKLR